MPLMLLGIATNVDNNKPPGAIPWVNSAENNNKIEVNSKSVLFLKLLQTMLSIQSDLPGLIYV